MNYVVLLKTVLDENGVHNEIHKISHTGEIGKRCMSCASAAASTSRRFSSDLRGTAAISSSFVTAIFDDEFLLNGNELYANQLASILYGYLDHGECLCGNVLLCWTSEDGECYPFCEDEADQVVKLLCDINKHIGDVEFKVHEPMLMYRPLEF